MLRVVAIVLALCAIVLADQSKPKWSPLSVYDSESGAAVTEDIAHYHIHACEYFFFADTATKNSGDSLRYTFTAPTADSNRVVHIVFSITGDGAIDYTLHKNSGGVSGGAAVGVYNPNFNCTRDSYTTVLKAPTITTVGTAVFSGKSGATGNAAGQSKVGGGARSYFEYVLQADSTYTVRAISRSASNRMSFSADWYEVSE